MEFEFTDRYKALGIPYPDPKTVCLGKCEGTGFVPISINSQSYVKDEKFRILWQKGHVENCHLLGRIKNFIKGIYKLDKIRIGMSFARCDGYHFVRCPDCKGSGMRMIIITN